MTRLARNLIMGTALAILPLTSAFAAGSFGVTVDTSKPIVVLVHGNSSNPNSWEEFSNSKLTDQDPNVAGVQAKPVTGFEFTVDSQAREMLATKLVKQGYRVIAVDLRSDLTVTLPDANPKAAPRTPRSATASASVSREFGLRFDL